MEKTGKLELSPQLLQMEKLAIRMPLPESPASGDLIGAFSGFNTPRPSASVPRNRASKLKNSSTGPQVHSSYPGVAWLIISASTTCLRCFLHGNNRVSWAVHDKPSRIISLLGFAF